MYIVYTKKKVDIHPLSVYLTLSEADISSYVMICGCPEDPSIAVVALNPLKEGIVGSIVCGVLVIDISR
jgi:hypothetical protein